jgi:hypothetical protein
MIVVIVEHCAEWEGKPQPYVLDTNLLKSQELKTLIEEAPSELTLEQGAFNETTEGKYGPVVEGWTEKYREEIQGAILQHLPVLVEKLITVEFL